MLTDEEIWDARRSVANVKENCRLHCDRAIARASNNNALKKAGEVCRNNEGEDIGGNYDMYFQGWNDAILDCESKIIDMIIMPDVGSE